MRWDGMGWKLSLATLPHHPTHTMILPSAFPSSGIPAPHESILSPSWHWEQAPGSAPGARARLGRAGQGGCGCCVSPVDAEGTEAEHRDAHRGFLDEGHQLADLHSEGPVLGQQLGRSHRSAGCFGDVPPAPLGCPTRCGEPTESRVSSVSSPSWECALGPFPQLVGKLGWTQT